MYSGVLGSNLVVIFRRHLGIWSLTGSVSWDCVHLVESNTTICYLLMIAMMMMIILMNMIMIRLKCFEYNCSEWIYIMFVSSLLISWCRNYSHHVSRVSVYMPSRITFLHSPFSYNLAQHFFIKTPQNLIAALGFYNLKLIILSKEFLVYNMLICKSM